MYDSVQVPGFLGNGVTAGIKDGGDRDLSLIFSEVPAKAVGVFTTNRFKAAPVVLDMERIKKGIAQAIIVNSGNANAATGKEGDKDAATMSRAVSEALGIEDELVLVASTGIIGEKLPIEKIVRSIKPLVEGLSTDGIPALAKGIITTDRFLKIECRKCSVGGREITICGIAKGAGMIEPNMATMLSFIMTDADIDQVCLTGVFKESVDRSFNAITVDGCMSTNDTAIMLANGVAGNGLISETSGNLMEFREALFDVMDSLARSIVKDGEGATKLIEIVVEEARVVGDAKKIAYAIANSNLVCEKDSVCHSKFQSCENGILRRGSKLGENHIGGRFSRDSILNRLSGTLY
ncbi:MAG: bifunctional glutamate N-acetyltransferase/amino-acid acetyltransferase ArgJ [Deltaproteobacteria bacterium]|nr:bifunctional glutamate N-acetyltransferase/amino-acid acetyltransferase ArgJ [Deltaproteobacteria bacterium]